ncbi:hypothetical protein [Draconibacterium mangrovi]|uniref:hypothetical protein n=1 Tax=Draconibacterium mangrovi TaxID=2697469 RepID=UPI0013D32EDB|nr:hypothetical protein [Draconibacterium mangrovi]
MRTFFNGLIKNLSNIFGILGILLTIYFGTFYVPSWIKENQNEKLNSSQQQTIQTIKELIYKDSTVTIQEIKTVVVGKELDEKISIPYTFYEILTLCQLSFIEDRFLPLERRMELTNKLEILKNQLIPEQAWTELEKSRERRARNKIIIILSIIISLIASGIGILSFYRKLKLEKDKQEEINNEIEESTVDISYKDFARQTEKEFIEALQSIKGIKFKIPARDEGYDLFFNKENKDYFIEFKLLTKSKVGLGSFKRFIYRLKDRPGEAWFIYNTDLTPLVMTEAKNFNNKNKDIELRLIKVNNKTELVEKVEKLLHTTKAHM